MMTKHSANGRNQLAMVTVDDLVLQDYLVRKIDEVLSFDFVYPVVEFIWLTKYQSCYSCKISLSSIFFSIRSMLHTIKKWIPTLFIVGS